MVENVKLSAEFLNVTGLCYNDNQKAIGGLVARIVYSSTHRRFDDGWGRFLYYFVYENVQLMG